MLLTKFVMLQDKPQVTQKLITYLLQNVGIRNNRVYIPKYALLKKKKVNMTLYSKIIIIFWDNKLIIILLQYIPTRLNTNIFNT